jgi:hypothetical protein
MEDILDVAGPDVPHIITRLQANHMGVAVHCSCGWATTCRDIAAARDAHAAHAAHAS